SLIARCDWRQGHGEGAKTGSMECLDAGRKIGIGSALKRSQSAGTVARGAAEDLKDGRLGGFANQVEHGGVDGRQYARRVPERAPHSFVRGCRMTDHGA